MVRLVPRARACLRSGANETELDAFPKTGHETEAPNAHQDPQPGDGERRSAIGGRIRATRIQAGIGLRQMARDLGMSASWLLGVELGQHSIDAVRLDDVSRYLGVPASYFLDDSAFVRERQRQLMSRPATRLDWQLMYDGEDERARAHFELDRVFQRLEEERGGRVERPAGGD